MTVNARFFFAIVLFLAASAAFFWAVTLDGPLSMTSLVGIEGTAKFLAFWCTNLGLAVSTSGFIIISGFCGYQAFFTKKIPGMMTNGQWVACAIVPLMKAFAILMAFGLHYYGTPSGL